MSKFRNFTKKNRTGLFLILYIVISLILLTFFGSGAKIRPQEAGQAVFSVFQHGISAIGKVISNTVNSIGELKELRSDYKELQKKVAEFENIGRSLEELEKENRILREKLDISENIVYKNIPAQIIGKDPSNFFTALTINKGLKHGIRINMPVIAIEDNKTILVGKIIEAGYLTSMIRPLFDLSSYVAARFQDSRYDGLIEGTGTPAKNLLMRYVNILAKDKIKYNDLLITTGYNDIYPEGIIIGRLKKIIPQQWESSLLIEVESAVNFSVLEYVFVLNGGLIEQE